MPMIIGEIRRHLRDNNSVRVSRSIRDTAYKALQVRIKLSEKLMREPTNEEIAKELEICVEDVNQALDAIQDPMSLYAPVYHDDGDAILVMDQVKDSRNTDEQWLDTISIKDGMSRLHDRERRIIQLRFFDGKTQVEVADSIGISQAQVSRLEKSALEHMKKYI